MKQRRKTEPLVMRAPRRQNSYLMPTLLDRLADHAPHRLHESPGEYAVTRTQMRDVILRGPSITVVRETADRYSFSDIVDELMAPPPVPPPPSKPARYSLNNIQILGGSVDLVDKPKQATHRVRDVLAEHDDARVAPHLVLHARVQEVHHRGRRGRRRARI